MVEETQERQALTQRLRGEAEAFVTLASDKLTKFSSILVRNKPQARIFE